MTLALCLALSLLINVVSLPTAAAQSFWDQLLVGVEVMIGEAVAQDVIAEYGQPIRLAPRQQERIDAAFADLVAQADRKEITYTLTILQSDVVNAFAAPGGFVFITTGLLGHIAEDIDALANVLGHEIAHIELKHGMDTLSRQLGAGLLLQLILGGSDETLQTVVAVAYELTRLGWSRDQEYRADDVGQRLAAAAGYDPGGMARFFEVLKALEGQEIPFLEFLRTHPLTSERAERARARAAALQIAPRAGDEATGETVAQRSVSRGGGASAAKESSATENSSATTSSGSPDRVVRRGSGKARSEPMADPLGVAFVDPAQRFSLRLPNGWKDDAIISYATFEFVGPDDERLWVHVMEPPLNNGDVTAVARNVIEQYREYMSDLVIEVRPMPATVGGRPGAYAKYRYGEDVIEEAYYLLDGESIYVIEFAASRARFAEVQRGFVASVQSFSTGPKTVGDVPVETLRAWPTQTVEIAGRLALEVSALWPVTYEAIDWTPLDGSQIGELIEIGGRGYMGIFVYEVDPATTAEDSAWEWLTWLVDVQPQLAIVEPPSGRMIGRNRATTFLVAYDEEGERMLQYNMTLAWQNLSYEVAIVYPEEGFWERRPIFDSWLQSLRPITP